MALVFLAGLLLGLYLMWRFPDPTSPHSAPLEPCAWCGHDKGDHLEYEGWCSQLVEEVRVGPRPGVAVFEVRQGQCPCAMWVGSLEWVE